MKITTAQPLFDTTLKFVTTFSLLSKKIGHSILNHKKAILYTTLFLVAVAERFHVQKRMVDFSLDASREKALFYPFMLVSYSFGVATTAVSVCLYSIRKDFFPDN